MFCVGGACLVTRCILHFADSDVDVWRLCVTLCAGSRLFNRSDVFRARSWPRSVD